jgi:HPt (histidine-containing phosphotransfer) domain-containing protein
MTSTERVLDPTRLEALAEELDSRPAALEFITQFLQILPVRLKRIKHTLAENDRETAWAAALSLATSASMAGADHLALLCRNIGHEVRAGNLDTARHASQGLGAHTAAVAAEITKLLDHASPDQPGTVVRTSLIPPTDDLRLTGTY